MTGPDEWIDHGDIEPPANPLPVKCPHCGFPDLDFVPQPYSLTRGIRTPVDLALAYVGNLLCRPRARRILECVVPDQCRFYGTTKKRTTKDTEWSLAVPVALVRLNDVAADVPRCTVCGEPKVAHPGSHYTEVSTPASQPPDIFKSLEWSSEVWIAEEKDEEMARLTGRLVRFPRPRREPPATHPWTRLSLGRDLCLSCRLFELLMRLKIKGLDPLLGSDPSPTKDDLLWVGEKLELVRQQGLGDAAPRTLENVEDTWFDGFLREHAGRGVVVDFASVEKKAGLKLPGSYKEFIAAAGPMIFEDIDGDEGVTVTILAPMDMDFAAFRHGSTYQDDQSHTGFDALLFAETDCGDGFCFDLGNPEGGILQYDHETDFLEPYAANFKECIHRFAETGRVIGPSAGEGGASGQRKPWWKFW